MRRRIGAIRPGYEADLIVLSGRDLFVRPKDQMIASLVLGELGGSVRTVIVGGEVMIDEGRSTRVDETALRAEVAAIVARSASAAPERSEAWAQGQAVLARLQAAVASADDGPPGLLRQDLPGVRQVNGQPCVAAAGR